MMQTDQRAVPSGAAETSIRQIAILLHSLPSRTHRVLLGQLGDDEIQCINDAMLTLGEVDAVEKYRVLKRMSEQLHAETQSVEKVESEIQDEIQIGRARVSKKRTHSVFGSDETRSELTKDSNANSAKDESKSEISSQSDEGSSALAPQQNLFGTQTDIVTGQAAVSPTPEVLQEMFAQFHQTQAAGVLPGATSTTDASAVTAEQDARSGHDSGPRLLPIGNSTRPHSVSDRGRVSDQARQTKNEEADAAELAYRVDRFLTELPASDLCKALGMVTTKEAFFVLCGLPNETAETVLGMLPRRQSRKVRSDMRRMGQIQLSDIDSAKQVVAEVAIRLTTQPVSFAA